MSTHEIYIYTYKRCGSKFMFTIANAKVVNRLTSTPFTKKSGYEKIR